jgi:hypothetical protein
MTINCEQLRTKIIQPVLVHIAPEIPPSLAAENLLLGTCAQESKMGTYLVQLGDGPAQGIFQMEPATELDITKNFLAFRKDLTNKIWAIIPESRGVDGTDLAGNLYYAAAMCRVHYYRAPGALPEHDDIPGLAAYWKKYYNTELGKGTEDEFIENYHRYVT